MLAFLGIRFYSVIDGCFIVGYWFGVDYFGLRLLCYCICGLVGVDVFALFGDWIF